MKYLLLILLISAMIIGHVIGETPHEAVKRMVRNVLGVGDGDVLQESFYDCFYQCTDHHPPPPPRPEPI